MKLELADLRRIILDAATENIRKVAFTDVTEDEDSDGNATLRIRVVVDYDDETLDPEQMMGLLRALPARLASQGEDRYPVLSFISKPDADRIGLEAA